MESKKHIMAADDTKDRDIDAFAKEEESLRESNSEQDSEMGLLNGSLRFRSRKYFFICNDGQELRRSPKHKCAAWTTWVISLNILVFYGLILFLLSLLSTQSCMRHLSDQDKWKVASYYGEFYLDIAMSDIKQRESRLTLNLSATARVI
jgi:hypothetical protein